MYCTWNELALMMEANYILTIVYAYCDSRLVSVFIELALVGQHQYHCLNVEILNTVDG